MNFLRTHPALLAMIVLVSIATVVLALIALMMARSGQSLRPIVWFAGFFALIIGPQFAYHLAVATGWLKEIPAWVPKSQRAATSPDSSSQTHSHSQSSAVENRAVRVIADEAALATDGARFREPVRVFGADVDPSLVQDARAVFGDALRSAQIAQNAFFATGEMAMTARFDSEKAAVDARDAYLVFFRVAPPASRDTSVVTFAHPSGRQRVRVALAGRTLFAWTAADDAALDRRAAAVDAVRFVAATGSAQVSSTPVAPTEIESPVRGRKLSWPVFACALALNLVVVVLWFFKGSTWAASTPAAPGLERASLAELRQRLLAVNELGVPFRVSESSSEPGAIEVEWRYADATWLDHARAHKLRRVQRLVLRFDESTKSVRVRESWSAFDASAGVTDAKLTWRAATGIVFFERSSATVFGLQLDDRGRLKPKLSYTYTFDLAEMKNPIRSAVTKAGWHWRQLVWDAPPALRWFTE